MTDTMKTEQRREAFEKWALSKGWHIEMDPLFETSYDSLGTEDAWIGWCAALDSQAAQAQPSGWKLVPIEPTEEMKAAGAAYANYDDPDTPLEGEVDHFVSRKVYKAMIAASPSHSKEPGDGDGVRKD